MTSKLSTTKDLLEPSTWLDLKTNCKINIIFNLRWPTGSEGLGALQVNGTVKLGRQFLNSRGPTTLHLFKKNFFKTWKGFSFPAAHFFLQSISSATWDPLFSYHSPFPDGKKKKKGPWDAFKEQMLVFCSFLPAYTRGSGCKAKQLGGQFRGSSPVYHQGPGSPWGNPPLILYGFLICESWTGVIDTLVDTLNGWLALHRHTPSKRILPFLEK